MLTVVLFGVGTDYVLFLLFRYRERLRAGDAPAEAIVAAVTRVGEAIFSAATAVVAAFAVLALATLGFFATLGPALAVGVAVMLAAALTLVPAVVTVLGRRVFWPAKAAPAAAPAPAFRRFAALGRLVARRPVAVIASGVVLLGGLSVAVAAYRPDYNPVDQLPSGTEATRAYAALQRGFPPGSLAPTELYVHANAPIDASAVAAFVTEAAALPGVAAVLPPSVATDGRTVDVPVVLAVDPYGPAALDTVAGPLRSAARAAAPPGTTVLVGGQTMVLADSRATTGHDLALVLPVAAGAFLLILFVMLRAALAPVYLVAAVAGGFAATLGAVTLVFQEGFGHSGLQFAMPMVLYLFVTAIGTDYNILMTARLREEIRSGHSPREAAARAVAYAGPSVAAAAVILGGTFGALLVSGVPFFAEIGFGVTFGIVLVAFVVSIVLVPAAAARLGGAAWWPAPDRRITAR
jgi:RND superfamily putative drug exporter